MTSCSSLAMRLRSSARDRSASPACAARSWSTSTSWRWISAAPNRATVTPAVQGAQPGSGLTHRYSAPNSSRLAAQ